MTDQIKVYVVDDHALFREGLLRLLEHDPHVKVVGSAGSPEAALAELSGGCVDVLILDYELGSDTALTVFRRLREQDFAGKILIVTAGLPDSDALQLIQMGAAGIFPKQNAPAELLRNISEVAEGKVLFEQRYLQGLISSAMGPTCSVRGRFTERDRKVLRLLLEGASNKEIAAKLQISESAVKASMQQLFAKTGVRTRSHLVRIALEELRSEL